MYIYIYIYLFMYMYIYPTLLGGINTSRWLLID